MKKLGLGLLVGLTGSAIYLGRLAGAEHLLCCNRSFPCGARALVRCAGASAASGSSEARFSLLSIRVDPAGHWDRSGSRSLKTGDYASLPEALSLAHCVLCVAVALLAAWWFERRRESRASRGQPPISMLLLAALVSFGSYEARRSWSKQYAINNPSVAPLSMDNEGDGPKARFSQFSPSCGDAKRFRLSTSWSRTHARAVTRIFTTSGRNRYTTSLHSIISGIARASSTCRTSRARSLRSGAAVVTIRRCFTAA